MIYFGLSGIIPIFNEACERKKQNLWLEIVWRVSGGCLAGVWQVSFGCLEGVLRVSVRCLKGVWRESMGGLNGIRVSQDW